MQNKNKINKTQVVSYYVDDMPDKAFKYINNKNKTADVTFS
jgi:hypothetical protein